jgi:Ser/Thr protein kinase RdoA (MazF antagonist)
MIDSDVQAVLFRYELGPGQVRSVEPLGNAGGWSGSRLWRIVDERGWEHCLRRWPAEHPTKERLRWIHSVLLWVGPQLPVITFPLPTARGESFVEYGGHLWERTGWRSGKADYHVNPTRPRLRAAMQTLARFHQLTAHIGPKEAAPPPAVIDRRRQFEAYRGGGLTAIERAMGSQLKNDIDAIARRLLAHCRAELEASPVWRSLEQLIQLPLQPAIRDIHHDHVLFTGDEVTGIIDFGAMRIDTTLTDAARLVGSLVGDDREARQFAFDAYSELRPLSEPDRRTIDLLDESGVVLGGLNWLKWLYVERRDMGPIDPILRRLKEIGERLERFARP